MGGPAAESAGPPTPPTRPTVGLALIARDEERTLPTLLESIRGAFDQVALLDTGSRDRTVEVFERWADREEREGRLPLGHRVGRHRWRDDFAEARTQADELLDTDWRAWADCDDEIAGATTLRELVADADGAGAVAVIADYDYAIDEHGDVTCLLRRERAVKAGCGQWVGRVHEAQLVHGPVVHAPRQLVRWVHRKPLDALRHPGDRNIRILEAWARDEPSNPRCVGYLGFEHAVRSQWGEADRWYQRLWRLEPVWGDERAQHARRWALVKRQLGDRDAARRLGWEAQQHVPWWPDNALTIAEAHQLEGELQHAAWWARHAMRPPDTVLIVNPLDYLVHARLLAGDCLVRLGQVREAVQLGAEALQHTRNPQVRALVGEWERLQADRDTVTTILGLAQQLAAGDQLDDALRVLGAAPARVRDDPQLVRLADELTHRRDRVEVPERGVPDSELESVCKRLPRAQVAVERVAAVVAR